MEISAIEYTAMTVSPRVNGEAKLVITEKTLLLKTLFGAEEVPFAEVNALSLADFVVTVKTESGDYVFSKMGNWCQPFFDILCETYNKAVLRSLFVKGDPIVTAKGEYSYTEAGGEAAGAAPVYVYDNSVVVLPMDLGARRVPLCFASGFDKGDFKSTLRLDTGESYTWAKLGYDTAPFDQAVENQIRALHEKTLAAVKEIDPSLSVAQAPMIARLVPQGAAAAFGQLSGIAPSFTAALESKIADTRAAETYSVFKGMCDPSKIYIGFRKNEAAAEEAAEGAPALTEKAAGGMPALMGNPAEGLPALMGKPTEGAPVSASDGKDGEEGETPAADPYLLWLIVPSPDGQFAAVEFAEADSATFVYKTGGDFDGFARQLNRALEAIDFKREVIRLSDEELLKPENADYFMAAKRTAALRFIRANFKGRVIHSSPDAWKRKLEELWSGA